MECPSVVTSGNLRKMPPWDCRCPTPSRTIGLMNRNETLSGKVEFPVLRGQLIPGAAQTTSKAKLSERRVAATLEFDIALQNAPDSINDSPLWILAGQNEFGTDCLGATANQLYFSHQFRIKCAEYWTKL